MARIVGLGGLFWKAVDPKKTYEWYANNLGLKAHPQAGAMLPWKDSETGAEHMTIWSVFPESSNYVAQGKQFMMNFIVDDLDAILAQLEAAGVAVDPKRDDQEYGRFGWFTDCDGNRVELWEPPKS